MSFVDKMNFKQHTSILVSLLLVLLPIDLQALPSGSRVVNGSVNISTASNTMSITASNRAIINYNSFNINSNEAVKFIQPNSSSVVLNRVVSANHSSILGELNANGKVFLVNPAGIYFGKNSVVNANSFLATTLDITDKDFLNDNYNFEQLNDMAKSYIIQKGSISVSPNGFVVLASPFVNNDGAIVAKTGHIVLGASDNFYIQFDPEGLINYDYKSTPKDDKPILVPKEYANEIIDNVINSGNDDLKIVQNGDKTELVGADSVALVNGKLEAKNIDIESNDYISLLNNSRLKANGGDITVFANKDTYSSKGASLTAEDGTVEISAKKRVTYDGSYIDARLFYMDPEEVVFLDSYDNYGLNFTAEATRSITLNEGATISTHGGDIEMDAPSITLEKNSKLLADSGDVTLNASSVEDAKIDIQDGVEIKGGDVSITATSYRDSVFDSDSDNPALKALSNVGDFFIDLPLTPIAYQDATTSSKIDIGSATISGATINIASKATSDVSVSALFQTLALAYGKSHATSSLHIKTGATLTSTSDTILSSEADSVNHVSAKATNILASGKEIAKENIAVAYSDTKADSSALVDSSVTINAGGDFKLLSTVNKEISTSATGVSYSAGLLGTAVAYSNSATNNNANLSGSISANSVEVTSKTYIDKVKTSSSAGVGNGFLYKFILEPPTAPKGFMNSLKTSVLRKTPNPNPKSSVTKRTMSAAFSYSNHTNNSEAKITNASVKAQEGISVNSNIKYGINGSFEDNGDVTIIGDKGIKTIAIATIDSTDQNQKSNSYSGAVVVTDISNLSNAYIGDGVTLDNFTRGFIGVYSNIYLEYNIDWRNIENFNTVKDIVPKVEDANFRGRLYTSYAQSNAQGTEDSYSGSFNDFKLSNSSDAHIGKNAMINQNGGFSRVEVIANNDIGALNFAGVVGWTYFGTNAQGTGVGGAYLNVGYTNNTNAYIDTGTKVKAKALRVSAIKNSKNLSISTAGGKAENAISGSFSYLKIDNHTNAYINSEDVVIANMDNNKLFPDEASTIFKVDAEDNVELSSGTGGVVWGKNVGVGVSTAINSISRDTRAYVDGSTVGITNSGYGGLLYVKAYNSGFINAFALSGTVSTSTPSSDDIQTTSSGGGKYGIGVSGDASLNLLTDQANAYIINSVFSNGLENIKILAENSNDTRTYSGAGVFSFAEGSKGLAGSFAMNVLNNSAIAYMDNSDIYKDDVDIIAQQSGEVVSMAGSGTVGTGIAGLAGSVAMNDMANETKSYINKSTFNIHGNLNMSSLDNQSYKFFAGSLGEGKSFGLGLSYGRSNAGNTIESYISNSDIESRNLYISSSQDHYIRGVSFSAAAGLSGMAVAANYGDNVINNTIDGYIENTYITSNDLSILAFDSSDIGIYTGTLVGSTDGSYGLSASVNEVKNSITAYTDYLRQKASQNLSNVTIKAYSKKKVNLVSVGGSASTSGISAAGGVVINSIKDNVNSYVGNASDFNVNSSMQIAATEQNDIVNVAGTLSGSSSAGIAGGVSTNIVENEINAYLDNSNIEVTGMVAQNVPTADNTNANEDMSGLDILAFSNESINSNVANLAAGGSGGVSASISVNLVEDQLNAYTQYSYINYWQVGNPYVDQEVRVRAVSQSDIASHTGAAAIGGSGAAGVATDTNIIKNTTNAYILGDHIKANNMVKTQSNSYDHINSIAVSGSGAGTAGVAGSVAVAVVNNENHAYNRDSYIDSDGDLEVSAKDTTSLDGVLAGALAVGGAAGVGASIAVTSISQKTQAHIDDSKINAGGDTSIIADNSADTTTYAANAALGGTAGVGGSITVNTIDSNAKAFTHASSSDSMLINQDDAYKREYQNVYIKSSNHSSITTTPSALSGGVTAGVGGAVDVSTIHNTSLAEVGSNTKINAERDLLVQAKADKNIESSAKTVAASGIVGAGGSVLVANINANIDSDSLDSTKGTEEYVNKSTTNSMLGDSLGDSDFTTQTKDELDSSAKIDVSDEFSADAPQSTTYAIIGDNSVINVVGSTTVQTVDTTSANLLSGSLSGGAVGAGGSVSIANIGMDTRAYIGKNVDLDSGSLDVESNLEFKDNSVKSITGQGGVVGLGAAVSKLNLDYENDAYSDDGAELTTNYGDLNIKASSTFSSSSVEATGAQVAGAAAGIASATYNQKGKTQALVSKNSIVVSGRNFNLEATHEATNLSVFSAASTGGIVSGSGSVSSIMLEPTLVAFLGDNTKLTAQNDVTIKTGTSSSISSDAQGVNISGFTVGLSSATSSWSPTLSTEVGSNTVLYANNFTMLAYENIDDSGNAITDNKIKSESLSAIGTLVGDSGSYSHVSSDAKINLDIGDYNSINTNGDITLDAKAYSRAETFSNGYAYGAFLGGQTTSHISNNAEMNLDIGDYTTLDSQKDIFINAYSRNEISSYAYGGTGGLLTVSYVKSDAKIDKNDISINIGKNSNLIAKNGDISIKATGYIDSNSRSSLKTISEYTVNNAESDNEVNQNVKINIGENSKIEALIIAIKSYVEKLLAISDSETVTTALGSDSTATANNDISSQTDLNINTGVSLIGENSVDLRSTQNGDGDYFQIKAKTASTIDAGVTGTVRANSNNDADVNSYLTTEKGSTISTKNLFAKTYAPKQSDERYETIADAKGNTVVNYVTQWVDKKVKKVEEVVSWIPFVGDVISEVVSWVWEKVEETVKVVTHSEELSSMTGSYSSNSVLNMNSDIYQTTSTPQKLNIDKNGLISSHGEISANIDGDNIVVNNLINHDIGSITLKSNGDLEGSSDVYLDNKYSDVTINNNSNKNLIINDIDVVSDNADVPNISLEFYNNNNYTTTYKTQTINQPLTINNYGTGDIVLNGAIDNYFGVENIYNQYGNIYAANENAYSRTTNININAEHGAIGSESDALRVILERVDDSINPAFSSNSFYDTYLRISGIDYRKPTTVLNHTIYSPNNIYLNDIVAGGNIDLTLDNIDAVHPYDLTNNTIYNVKNLQAKGDIEVDLGSFSNFNLNNGYISSGLKDQTVTIYPNLPDTRYIASVDNENINLKDITHGGGKIDINIQDNGYSRFTGSGTIETLSGYRHVNIDNTSNKNLNVGAVTTVASIDNGFYINGVKKYFDDYIKVNTFGYDSGAIVVNSNNGGKIQLSKNLSASNGYIKITGNNGIYAENSALIDSKDIYLDSSEGGSIGDEANPLFVSSSVLDAKSADNLNIHSVSDLKIEKLEANQDLNLYSDGFIKSLDLPGSSIVANRVSLNAQDEISSIDGNAMTLLANTIFARSDKDSIALSNSKESVVTGLSAGKDINFASQGDLTIGVIEALKSVKLSSEGAIISNDAVVNVSANDVLLSANNGIGTYGAIYTKTKTLDVTNSKSGDINIKNQGSLRVDDLDSNGYALYNKSGDIKIETDSSFTQADAKSIFAGKDIILHANNDILLSNIKSLNDVEIKSLNGDILGNLHIRPTISVEKDLALYAHNGVVGTIKNPVSISMKDGKVIIEAGKTDRLLSTYILGINSPTGSFVCKGFGLFNNRIVEGTLLEDYYGMVVNSFADTKKATKKNKLPQDIVSPKFKENAGSYIIGSL